MWTGLTVSAHRCRCAPMRLGEAGESDENEPTEINPVNSLELSACLVEYVRSLHQSMDAQQFAALCSALGEQERHAVEYALR